MSLVHPRSMAAVLALKGSFFRLEPELDQAADGFGAAGHVGLFTPPPVNLRQLFLVPPLADEGANPSPGSTHLLFVVRNSCSLHDFMLTERQAEGKRELPPRL